jgi:CheY-like chemotaxis protein
MLEEARDIDLALVDIMMPVMDGYATIGAMHRVSSRHGLPILAVTAKMEPDEPARCIDAGARACISKPIDTANLLRAIRDVLPPRPLPGR